MKNGDRVIDVHWDTHKGADTTKPQGLTKREYFAAMAMQGLLSNPDWMREHEGKKYLLPPEVVAEVAIDKANALLKALEDSQFAN